MNKKANFVLLISSLIPGIIGVISLAGWILSIHILTSFLPSQRPINPYATLGLVLTSAILLLLYYRRVHFAKYVGGFLILMIAVLTTTGMDTKVFNELTLVNHFYVGIGRTGIICFLLIGAFPFLLRKNSILYQFVSLVSVFSIFTLSLLSVFGLLYVSGIIYKHVSSFVMSFTLALAFLITSCLYFYHIYEDRLKRSINEISTIGWMLLLALIFIQIATYGAWQQAKERYIAENEVDFQLYAEQVKNSIEDRFQVYSNALYGFRGLFISSDQVDQGEFNSYYEALDLNEQYPGVRTISHIVKVDSGELEELEETIRSDKSINEEGNPEFEIEEYSQAQTHYVATYINNVDGGSSLSGSDLSNQRSRVAAFEKASNLNDVVSSEPVVFGQGTSTEEPGFFITVPLNSKSDNSVIGFVNVLFEYTGFFDRLFADSPHAENTQIVISDLDTKKLFYTSGSDSLNQNFVREFIVTIANRDWKIQVSADTAFNTNFEQQRVPILIIIGGQLFSIFLIVVFVLLNQRREKAQELAEKITKTLREKTEQLEETAKELEQAQRIGHFGTFSWNLNTNEVIWSRESFFLHGLEPTSDLTMPLEEEYLKIIHPEDIEKAKKSMKVALQSQSDNEYMYRVVLKSGPIRWIKVRSKIMNLDGDKNLQGTFQDVTKAVEIDRMKTEFISLASHQLRTPLSAMKWFLEMLQDGDAGKLNKEQKEYIDNVVESNERMIFLVNALLNISRIESGRLVVDPKPTYIKLLVESVISELSQKAKEKKVAVILSIHKNLPKINVDSKLMAEVFSNLISNAIKYTPTGGEVTVIVSQKDNDIVSQVTDTGMGIPKGDQENIFKKFFRASNVVKSIPEGTGLGLYMVKSIVESSGGKLWFTSEENKGTTFWFSIPKSGMNAKQGEVSINS